VSARTLIIVLTALCLHASGSAADELDAWCAQVKKASSIVICSDAELRQQAAARQHFFDKLRETLSADAYKTLMADQTRWVKSYTANCGVPIDGAVPQIPIPQSVIECYRQATLARNVYLLNAYGAQAPQPTAPVAPAAPALAAPAAPAAPNANWQAAMKAWYGCLYEAVDTLAAQPEPAQTVADAAFGSCTRVEETFRESGSFDFQYVEKLKAETMRGQVVARVMAIRAAVSKLREKPAPSDKSGATPAIDYNRM
jgi:hypothetical protein